MKGSVNTSFGSVRFMFCCTHAPLGSIVFLIFFLSFFLKKEMLQITFPHSGGKQLQFIGRCTQTPDWNGSKQG